MTQFLMSENKINNIAVLGLGSVGELAAIMLQRTGFSVTGVDTRLPDSKVPFKLASASAASTEELTEVLKARMPCSPAFHII